LVLQSAIKANSGKTKKDKKKGKKGKDVSFADGPAPGDGLSDEEAAAGADVAKPKKAVEMSAEDLADEEWGSVKEKKSKKRKGKKAAAADEEDEEIPPPPEPVEEVKAPTEMTAEEFADEEFGIGKKKGKKGKKGAKEKEPEPEPEPEPAAEPAEEPAADNEDGEDGAPKILSKKEKEKLKKEKEKVCIIIYFTVMSDFLYIGKEEGSGCGEERSSSSGGNSRCTRTCPHTTGTNS
jgi:translation initiation factor 5B